MTVLMRENIIFLFYLIPNIAQSMSDFCTLVTETNYRLKLNCLVKKKQIKAQTTYLRKEYVFPKGKFCLLFSEGVYPGEC